MCVKITKKKKYLYKLPIILFQIAVRVMEGGGGEVKELRSASNPTVIFMDRNGQKEVVDNAAATRKDLTKLIMKKYNLFRSMLPFNKAGTGEGPIFFVY